MITREQLVEMFAQIARDTDWDLAKPMLWGYFFTDSDKTKLERVAPLLEQQGYRFVEIFQTEKEDPGEPDMWWLHVEKVEVHTPVTLDQRNQKFYQFADEHHLDTYDGMDVGPVQKPN